MPDGRLSVAIIKETSGAPLGSGVYTAFTQVVDQLGQEPGVTVHVNRIPPDVGVIHAHTTMWRYLLASHRHPRRLIVSAHEVPDTYLGSFVFDRACKVAATHMLRFVFNRARLVLAVSPHVEQELRQIGVTTEIEVLCNGIDLDRFRPDAVARQRVRARLGIAPDRFVVVNAAQIQPRKGVEMFLAVARRMPHVEFVWLGGRPFGRLTADYDHLTRLMAAAPPNVRFPGQMPLEEMPGYYAMADVCFFPSLQECFGYTIVEAAAVGLPVVVLDRPAYRGYLFDHYLAATEPGELVGIIDRLRTDRDHYRHWRERALALADRYDLRKHTRQLLELYRRIAADADRAERSLPVPRG